MRTGAALQHAPAEFQEDEDLILAAMTVESGVVSKGAAAFKFAVDRLRADRRFCTGGNGQEWLST